MLCKQTQKMSNLRISQNHKGLTLVEVIAMIAVLSVVMAVVAGFMISGAKMSAKVSDNAGASIREQTAVEFINKTLSKAPETVTYVVATGEAAGETVPTTLFLGTVVDGEEVDANIPVLYSKDGVVYYQANGNASPTELCKGKIRFILDEAKTEEDSVYIYSSGYIITYELNGTEHTVHSRVVATRPD